MVVSVASGLPLLAPLGAEHVQVLEILVGGPLHDNHVIFGFPELSGAQREKVGIGNATMRATARIVRCAIACRVPVFLENPNSSMIWQAPPIKRLIQRRRQVLHDGFLSTWG